MGWGYELRLQQVRRAHKVVEKCAPISFSLPVRSRPTACQSLCHNSPGPGLSSQASSTRRRKVWGRPAPALWGLAPAFCSATGGRSAAKPVTSSGLSSKATHQPAGRRRHRACPSLQWAPSLGPARPWMRSPSNGKLGAVGAASRRLGDLPKKSLRNIHLLYCRARPPSVYFVRVPTVIPVFGGMNHTAVCIPRARA